MASQRQVSRNAVAERLDAALVRIWRYRWLSIGIAWLVCCLGWGLVATWPTRYQSSAVVFADVGGMRAVASLRERLVGDQPINQLRNSLIATPTLEAAADRLKDPGLVPEQFAAELSLRAATPPIFVVAYEHDQPGIAQRRLDALLQSFLGQHFERKVDTAALDQQIAAQQQAFDQALTAVDGFKQANATTLAGQDGVATQLKTAQDELARLQAELKKASDEQADVRARLAETPPTLPAGPAQNAGAAEAAAQLPALRDRLAQLRVRYAESHPYIAEVKQAIEQLGVDPNQPPTPAAPSPPKPNPEYERNQDQLVRQAALIGTLRQKIADQERALARLAEVSKAAPSLAAQLGELNQRRQAAADRLEALRGQRDQLIERQRADLSETPFRLIDPPSLPSRPAGPSRLLLLAVVLLLGAAIGGAAALVSSRLQGVFETARELRQRLNVAVAGSLSDVTPVSERVHRRLSHVGFGVACAVLLVVCSSLMVAEWRDALTPLGGALRDRLVG
jgi:polysaccharide chain length determinant protein (PEP-CTERM system associated)